MLFKQNHEKVLGPEVFRNIGPGKVMWTYEDPMFDESKTHWNKQKKNSLTLILDPVLKANPT